MEVHFIRIDPARDAYRFYSLVLWPDLFRGVSLAREWGRIGQPGQLRLDRYEDEEQAGRALRKVAASKQRRGYRQTVRGHPACRQIGVES